MCTSSQIIGSLLVLSVLEIGLGVSSVAVGAVSFSLVLTEHKPQLGDSSPFLLCGICGILCAKKKVWTYHDTFFCLLHLWTNRRNFKFSISSCSHKEVVRSLFFASCLHVSCMHWNWWLHPFFMAHLSASQL